MNPTARPLTLAILALALAGSLAGCGPLPQHLTPGWDQPSNINGVTGERNSSHG